MLSRFYVYSCNEDYWREIKPNFPFNVPQMWCVVTVKGIPYWMGFTMDENDESNVSEVCISFDVQNEVFQFLALPQYESNSATGACLVNLKDSLADMMFSPGSDQNKLVDVYTLDEKFGTWSKIYTVGPIPLEVQRVLHCFINGEIVIVDSEGKLVLYDPKSERIKNLQIDKARELSYKTFSYRESLVAIKEMKHVREDDGQETSPSRRKR